MSAKSNLSHCVGISVLLILGMLFFTMTVTPPMVLGQSNTPESTNPLDHNQVNNSSTTTLFLPIIFVSQTKILCDGQVYDGYTDRLFVLETKQDKDPAILKIIRNCTFRNSNKPPITFNDAQNVLIEGNTFENIRTNIPGVDVHAIDIRCQAPCNINNVMIKNNRFNNIGADGIQLGNLQRNIKNVTIQNNIFQGNNTTGENGIDIKGVNGPIFIRGNSMHGFRPCESPTSNPPGNQDCSGSNGQAMFVHDGQNTGSPSNIFIEGNRFYDSIIGLYVSGNASNVTIRNNDIFDNLSIGLYISGASNVIIEDNRFQNNPENMKIRNCTNCTIK
jgi:parallel beta-helix repeat protein